MKLYDDALQAFAKTRVGGWLFVNVFNHLDRVLMRATSAKLSTAFGSRLAQHAILLECTGAKSGVVREVPLLSTPDGDAFILVASNVGKANHPSWYHNLRANPRCRIHHQGQRIDCVARELAGAEREHAWRLANVVYEGYDTYQGRTARFIPVMRLERA